MKVSGVLKSCTFATFSDFVENSYGEARGLILYKIISSIP